jgi:hypothetical protein
LFSYSLLAQVAVRGTYADPRAFWNTGARLDDYGVNAIFVHSGSITPALMERARSEGARVYAEFATLNGRGYVDRHPEAWPVNEKGEKAAAATWFMGACPTEPGFRAYRRKQLIELLERFDLAGVWLDYLHWHAQFEDPRPVLPETCFSDTCLAAFSRHTRLRLPEGDTAEKARWILSRHDAAWREWRTAVIADWAREFREIVKRKRPGALIGNYQCPWTDEEFQGARRRVLGLDLDLLSKIFDVLSPMVYHGRMGRTPAWVGEYVGWLAKRTAGGPALWPIVQAHNDPGLITAAEFDEVLRLGASGGATGVMMFTIRSVAEDPAKLEVMRRRYRQWAGPLP